MEMKAELIAPCGMNCRLCYGYIRPKNPCGGCNAPDEGKPKSCTNCKIVVCEIRLKNGWDTCAPCDRPCRRLKDLDKRYRTKYHMSMIENLACIHDDGMDGFLKKEEKRRRCSACGEVVCVHREECPNCGVLVWEKA